MAKGGGQGDLDFLLEACPPFQRQGAVDGEIQQQIGKIRMVVAQPVDQGGDVFGIVEGGPLRSPLKTPGSERRDRRRARAPEVDEQRLPAVRTIELVKLTWRSLSDVPPMATTGPTSANLIRTASIGPSTIRRLLLGSKRPERPGGRTGQRGVAEIEVLWVRVIGRPGGDRRDAPVLIAPRDDQPSAPAAASKTHRYEVAAASL